jgi:hypothetical protein
MRQPTQGGVELWKIHEVEKPLQVCPQDCPQDIVVPAGVAQFHHSAVKPENLSDAQKKGLSPQGEYDSLTKQSGETLNLVRMATATKRPLAPISTVPNPDHKAWPGQVTSSLRHRRFGQEINRRAEWRPEGKDKGT